MTRRRMTQQTQAWLSAAGCIAFGIAMFVLFVLGVTHTVKTKGSTVGVAVLLALCCFVVEGIGVAGILRVRKLGLDRPEEPQ